MCGIVGIAGVMPVNQSIYDALTVLQHRGQDAAGIITIDANNCFRLRKANGLVSDVFEARHMQRLQGNMGIGHVRYPTAGSSSASEAQPFYVNSPYGITLAHNGNLTNAHELRKKLFEEKRRHINTTSDSEILLNIFASELDNFRHYPLEADNIFAAIAATNRLIRGAYACVAMIIGHGMVAFRDPNGIRPLVLGKRDIDENRTEYMVASESVALDTLGFDFLRDVAPGEAIYITEEGQLFTRQCADNPVSNPCLFEYVYFARPDSFIDKISVYSARVNMGTKLGEKIAREWEDLDIDVVIPIPETSCDIALEIARILGKPYRQGFVKNRYVGRTFIMPGQQLRRKSVRRKLNANRAEFRDKNVLLVDDSIVRGTTSEQIIEMAREAGAKKVYLASAAPEIRFPNVYGIDMPSATELIAHGREVDEIRQIIGADGLIFQDLNDLIEAVRAENPDIQQFECSVFNGVYVTKDVDQGYLDFLDTLRNDDAKAVQRQNEVENLEMHNEGWCLRSGCRSGTLTCNSRRNPAKSACKSDRATIYETTYCGHQRCQRRDLWRALITGSARCHRYRNASGNEPGGAPDLIPRNGFFPARSAGVSRCHARCARYCRQHLFRFFPDAGDGDFTLFNQNPFRHCP